MRAAIYLMATVMPVLFVGCQGTTMADKSKKRGYFGTVEIEIIHKIVYVIDRSGSMADSLHYVKLELKRSIGELGEDDEFHVIFFSSGPPLELPPRRLIKATERNQQLAFEFIDAIVPQGETDPVEAIKRAFAVGPDVVFLLTDGEFDRSIVDLTKRLNVGGKVTVHTISLIYQVGEEVLKQIAEQNNGNYKFVSEADLEAMFPE